MDNYYNSLLDSVLPFDPWAVVLMWLLLFAANHWLARQTRAANDAQTFVGVEDWGPLRRVFSARYVVAQALYAAIVFAIAFALGGPAFVFFAGGLVVATANGLALNAQGLLTARAMGHADAAKGKLTFSTATAIRHNANRVTGTALACVLIGLALAQLALLGGAFFPAATAGGYPCEGQQGPRADVNGHRHVSQSAVSIE